MRMEICCEKGNMLREGKYVVGREICRTTGIPWEKGIILEQGKYLGEGQ